MAKKSRETFQKREKQKARQQKQKDKEVRRAEAKQRKVDSPSGFEGEDSDIAGIRPGPQPLPDEWGYINNSSLEPVGKATDDNL